jgi:hypothetical protein
VLWAHHRSQWAWEGEEGLWYRYSLHGQYGRAPLRPQSRCCSNYRSAVTTATTLGIPDYRPAPLPPPTAPQYKLRNLFSGAFDRVPDVTPLPVTVPRHTKGQLEYAAALLGAAKKPVFIVASQATLFDGRVRSADEVRGPVRVYAVRFPCYPAHVSLPRATSTVPRIGVLFCSTNAAGRPPCAATVVQHMHQLQASLLALGVPCFLSGMARGLLGRNSPIHIRQNRKQALREVCMRACEWMPAGGAPPPTHTRNSLCRPR